MCNHGSSSKSSTTNSGAGVVDVGSLNHQIDAPTMQNNVLVIIHANPIQKPPKRRPSWKTPVIDRLATMLPTDWSISTTVYRRAVSSRSTKVVTMDRARNMKPDPDVWMIMAGTSVAMEGESPIPSVPTVRKRILARASQRSFSVAVFRGLSTRRLR